MPKVMFDFGGAPARYSGSGGSDWVPPGRYALRIEEFVETKSKSSDRPMFRVTYAIASGDQVGKRIVEHFVKDSEVAMGRCKGLLSCVAGKEIGNRIEINTDNLKDKEFVADVIDDEQQATEQYSARTVSKIGSYVPQFKNTGGNGAQPAQESAPEPAAVAAPAEAEAAPEAAAPAEAEAQSGAEAADDLFA